MFKSGFVSIVGKPNAGKSTLLNTLVGEKVAIVSWHPQATRNKINGVLNADDCQIVFVDTPGIHQAKNKLGEYMMKSVKSALEGVDAVIYMIAADKKFDESDLLFVQSYIGGLPLIAVINKVDAVSRETVFQLMDKLKNAGIGEIVPISALKKQNTDLVLTAVKAVLHEGEKYFPDDIYTDSNLRFMASEIIRESAMSLLKDEVPYGISVNIGSFDESGNTVRIGADIIVEKKAHKPIVIGKGGSMLKSIGTRARIKLEKLIDSRVFLELWVKVKEDWRDSEYLVSDFGYNDKEL